MRFTLCLLALLTSAITLSDALAKTHRVDPNAYTQSVKGWHAKRVEPKLDATGKPFLVLRTLNRGEQLAISAQSDAGGFSAFDLDRVSHLLRDGAQRSHPVEPKLVDSIYHLQRAFGAGEILVISGYRAPGKKNRNSNHSLGRAIDIVIPGTTDEELADTARQAGFAGVGVYPISGFVHIDVRTKSYFWIDRSAPRKRNRERGILGDLAKKSDAEAKAAGRTSVARYGISTNVDSWLKASGEDAPELPMDEDDTDAEETP